MENHFNLIYCFSYVICLIGDFPSSPFFPFTLFLKAFFSHPGMSLPYFPSTKLIRFPSSPRIRCRNSGLLRHIPNIVACAECGGFNLCEGWKKLFSQSLSALRAGRRVSLVFLTAVKASVYQGRVSSNRFRNHLLSFIPGDEVKGEEKNKHEKNAHRPEEALSDGKAMFLGIEKDPEGNRHNDRPENKFQGSPRRWTIKGLSAFVQKLDIFLWIIPLPAAVP